MGVQVSLHSGAWYSLAADYDVVKRELVEREFIEYPRYHAGSSMPTILIRCTEVATLTEYEMGPIRERD